MPIGILQYYLKSKTLYLLGVAAQVIAILIFGNFIFEATDFIAQNVAENAGPLDGLLRFFLGNVLNLILMLVAAMCYGFSKEVNDITNITYVLNNASPDQYKSIFATNNIAFGVGSFLGLLISGFILSPTISPSPKFIIFHILLIILIIFFVMNYYFDNAKTTLDLKEVQKFQVYLKKSSLSKARENITQVVSSINMKQTLSQTKYLFLRPMVHNPNMITM